MIKAGLVALGVGLLVGAIYSLLGVRSPAPPIIALIGLLGMLLGEQAVPLARRLLTGQDPCAVWRQTCAERVTGLPPAQDPAPPAPRQD